MLHFNLIDKGNSSILLKVASSLLRNASSLQQIVQVCCKFLQIVAEKMWNVVKLQHFL